MLPPLARKAASRTSSLLRRRLRHAGLDEKKKRWLARNLGGKIGHVHHESLQPSGKPSQENSPRRSPRQTPGNTRCVHRFMFPVSEASSLDVDHQTMFLSGANGVLRGAGEAPVVIPHKLPLVVTRRSKTTHHRDANIARMPSFPFEPMFQSLSVLRPSFKFDAVDLIINRNSLNHLFRFADGVVKKDFRLDLAMVHNTLIVTPAWERVSEIKQVKPNFGRDFEDLFLQRQLRESGTYHRAIRYELGPLNCAVLSELDAALPTSGEAMVSNNEQWVFQANPGLLPSSELSDECQPNTRAEEILFGPRDPKASKEPRLRHQPHSEVIPAGTGTLSKDAAELTASAKIKKMSQLWLGRVPFLVRGTHSGSSFTRVNVSHFATSFAAYETRVQDQLQKLVSLIGTLTEFARDATDQRCIVICDKTVRPRELRIFHHNKTPPLPLPADMRRHFWASKDRDGKPGSTLSSLHKTHITCHPQWVEWDVTRE